MPADDHQPPSAERSNSHPERCADCGAALVEDQRYCLQCGARRGQPRIDFSAFWKQSSPTDVGQERGEAAGVSAGTGGSWFAAGAPSRRMAGALAAGVLAVGIVAGAALGPAPASSPADSSTLARQAIAALVASASGSPQASAPTNPTAAPSSDEPSAASSVAHKSKATSSVSGKTSAPTSSEGSSSGESSTSSSSSEGSSTESSSSKGSTNESEQPAPGTPVKLPPVKHVWVITLSGASFANALAQPQTDPYLAKQLVPKGTLLSGYTLGASSALANGIALLSGQGVNLETEQNCPTYNELQPATVNATNGLAEGVGCVYPAAIKTLPDELTAAGLTWKAYVQGMQEGAPGTTSSPAGAVPAAGAPTPSTTGAPAAATGTPGPTVTCRRPELGTADPNHVPAPGDPYLTFRNPFVYFHSLLDGGACASNDVDLSQLQSDLAAPASTPSLSWIVPSACEDGSSTPCSVGATAGLGPADGFLKEVVAQILATSAYRKEGLIVIVPDSAPTSSAGSAKPVGALLISPFVHSGARVSESLNGFSISKNLARLFGVLPLGHANDPSTVSFGATVYGKNGKAAAVASTAKKAAQAASATQPRRLPASYAGG